MTGVSYVTQLIDLYEREINELIETQDPFYSFAISTLSTHLSGLKQARLRCMTEDQLYCVNRIARILGEIKGYKDAKEREPEKTCPKEAEGEVRDPSDG